MMWTTIAKSVETPASDIDIVILHVESGRPTRALTIRLIPRIRNALTNYDKLKFPLKNVGAGGNELIVDAEGVL